MTVDVYVSDFDDAFIEDIDEIIEDTMVQMFILHPKDQENLDAVQDLAKKHNSIFYAVPASLLEQADANCVAVSISTAAELSGLEDRVIMVDEQVLDTNLEEALKDYRGIVLNATKTHDSLENFFLSIGPNTIEAFNKEELNKLSMDKLVLQSYYPQHHFDTILPTVKKISDVMFRPDQSIVARATKNSLELFGFKK